VVAFGLVGVGLGELADGAVEGVAAAEVGGDRHPVAAPRVSAGQGPAADFGVDLEPRRGQLLDLDRALPVPELAHVEVTVAAVEADRHAPAEEDVPGRLHQPLAFDHAAPVVAVAARPGVGLEHRGFGLLRLQEERVFVVAPGQQDHPGAGADAPHPDHLAGEPAEVEAVEQVLAVAGQGRAVGGEHVAQR
jgi:hypothetical protein